MIDHLHNLASVVALANQIGGSIHGQLQQAYDWYMNLFDKSFFNADIMGGMLLTMVVFWTVGALYTVLDLTQWPNCLYQYKTQDKNVTVLARTFSRLRTHSLFSFGLPRLQCRK